MNAEYDMMEYQARQKSLVVSYVLWLFLGLFGAHRFYAGNRVGTAVAQLVCTVLVITSPISAVWALVDAFLIPGWIKQHNLELAGELRQRDPGRA
ncbi:TM2 domain-containing membrane protein YozV [Actinopolyspora alba]|uniref:TM2 domain-containing membrane protein YozV n=1 Tax=Actinopolyspora alba TaxID=673379 RepID=A0A1I1TLD0_9ACTN|nr:TM2 domain-containing protein [Actinopolyspora alba]SFD59335.1 TM2 domain-containing membrane protein YozV [Actinopolyspora alba]